MTPPGVLTSAVSRERVGSKALGLVSPPIRRGRAAVCESRRTNPGPTAQGEQPSTYRFPATQSVKSSPLLLLQKAKPA